jgi:GNAT superfamily N-acetyltransferase
MKWPTVNQLTELAPLPSGYSYAFPTRTEIPQIVLALQEWYPGIAVGNASCHMRESFYTDRVFLGEADDREFLVTLLKYENQIAAIFSVERDLDSRVIYGRIGAISPEHRGAHLSRALLSLEEAIGRAMGMGMVYGLATLKYPYFQRTFERMGWQLIGIMPGFDQELVAPDEVRRVYEAVYVKVLEPNKLLAPDRNNMTEAVRELYDLLFERSRSGRTDA